MNRSLPPTWASDLKYFSSLALVLTAAFSLLLQLRREYNLGADIRFYQVGIAALLAGGWFFLAHHKGLVQLRSAPWSYGLFHAALGLAMALLFTGILLDPLKLTGLSAGWEQALARLQSGQQSAGLSEMSVLELLRSGVGTIFSSLWDIFLSAFWFLARIAITFLCLVAVLSGLVALIVMYFTDIKSGVLIVLLGMLLGAAGWFLQVTDSEVNFGLAGVVALLGGVLIAVNWRSLYINVDVEEYHPQFYQLITRLNRLKKSTLSRATVREEIGHLIGAQAGELTPQVVDAIERRLVEERLLVPQSNQSYAPGFQKRLRTYHVFIGGLTLLYVFNPGFGLLELIPDNLPLIGNLDEVALAVGVFTWLYRLYLKDHAEARGEYAILPDLSDPSPSGPREVLQALPPFTASAMTLPLEKAQENQASD